MSSFRGLPEERWSLARAVDALRDAARAAGRPGWIWVAGLFYPTPNLGLNNAWQLVLRSSEEGWSGQRGRGVDLPLVILFGGSLVLALFLPLWSRLTAGLARVSPPDRWRELAGRRGAPGLRAVWRAGRGLTLSTLGMWVLLAGLFLVPALVILLVSGALAGFVQATVGDGPSVLVSLVLAGPVLALLALYAAVISLLHQLALHSLAHNRRGVASALVHAWRIARHDPWATGRAVALDLVLYLSVLVLAWGVTVIAHLTCLAVVGVDAIAVAALGGFAGVTRAGFWARAYRALGGLSPDDGVPGLETPDAPILSQERLV